MKSEIDRLFNRHYVELGDVSDAMAMTAYSALEEVENTLSDPLVKVVDLFDLLSAPGTTYRPRRRKGFYTDVT